ncbi:hypothetical protein EJB05_23054, partial [Eragrostis curvula]
MVAMAAPHPWFVAPPPVTATRRFTAPYSSPCCYRGSMATYTVYCNCLMFLNDLLLQARLIP